MKHGIWTFVAIAALVCSMSLAGCGKKKESAETPSPSSDQKATTPAPEPKAATPSVNLQDGQWEITMSVEMPDMPGMPAGAMKPQTVTKCLSKADYVPPAATPSQPDCKVTEQKVEGSTVSWAIACKDSNSKGKVTYSGDSYDGVMESTVKMEGKEMNTKMVMKGKRIGPCPQK
jgi:hypothetical protein